MIVTPKGDMLVNMKSDVGIGSAEFDPRDKYYKPAGFGGALAPHYEYIEFGRNPWQYRPSGSAIAKSNEIAPYPRLCAHRGLSAALPENSLPAFGAAVGLGAEEIEFDLWTTKDGKIVSSHDPTLERVSNGKGFVYEHTLDELLALDFGKNHGESFKGLKIATFEEILKKFACHTIMNIHIKFEAQTEFEKRCFDEVVSLIKRYDCEKYVYFMISNDSALAYAAEKYPSIPRCLGYAGNKGVMIERALKYGCKKNSAFQALFRSKNGG